MRDGREQDTAWREMVTVASFARVIDAHMLQSALVAQGIDAVVTDEHLVGINWYLANAVGGVKVQVPADELDRARDALGEIASSYRSEPEPEPIHEEECFPPCPQCGSRRVRRLRVSWLSFLTLFLSVEALLIPSRRYFCEACGRRWRTAPAHRSKA